MNYEIFQVLGSWPDSQGSREFQDSISILSIVSCTLLEPISAFASRNIIGKGGQGSDKAGHKQGQRPAPLSCLWNLNKTSSILISLTVICMSSLEKHLFSSAQFLIFSFWIELHELFYIFWILFEYHLQIFFFSLCGLSFVYRFSMQKLLKIGSHLFSFVSYTFGDRSKNTLPQRMSECSACFPVAILWFLVLHLGL